MSCRDKLYLVTSKDLVSLRTTQHETASPPCTPRKKQPSYATVGTGPREACLTSSYVTNSTKRCDNNHAQRAFLTFGCSSLRQIAEALAKRWQRPCALAQHLLLGALQGGAVVESLFALEEILEGRYQARTVLQHVANLEMLGESEGFQSGAVQCCPKRRFSWKADASSPDVSL